jgi:hypothetical protein
VGTLIQQRLNRPGGISLGQGYRVRADHIATDPDDPNNVTLSGITFVEVNEQDWVRFGTAQVIQVRFNRQEDGEFLEGTMLGVSYYDRQKQEFFDAAQQSIGRIALPSLVPLKVKYLNLHELIHYLARPGRASGTRCARRSTGCAAASRPAWPAMTWRPAGGMADTGSS